MSKTKRIITEEKIIRVETNDGRVADFSDNGDQYSGGRHASFQYISDSRENDLDPQVYIGTVVTDLELVDNY